MKDDRSLQEQIEQLPPADVVATDSDPEDWLSVIRAEGHEMRFTGPPRITTDADGNMTGIEPGSTGPAATLGELNLTGPEWETLARHLINKYEGAKK